METLHQSVQSVRKRAYECRVSRVTYGNSSSTIVVCRQFLSDNLRIGVGRESSHLYGVVCRHCWSCLAFPRISIEILAPRPRLPPAVHLEQRELISRSHNRILGRTERQIHTLTRKYRENNELWWDTVRILWWWNAGRDGWNGRPAQGC